MQKGERVNKRTKRERERRKREAREERREKQKRRNEADRTRRRKEKLENTFLLSIFLFIFLPAGMLAASVIKAPPEVKSVVLKLEGAETTSHV